MFLQVWAKTALPYTHTGIHTHVSDLCETLKAIMLGRASSFVLSRLLEIYNRQSVP